MPPFGLIGLHIDGLVDLIEYNSFATAEFVSKTYDFKHYFEEKNAYGLEKISDNHFLVIDDYFTLVLSVQID